KGNGPISAIAFSPDGHLVLACNPTDAQLWEPSTGKILFTFKGDSHFHSSAAFSSNALFALIGNDEGTAHLWSTTSGKEVAGFRGHTARITSVTFLQDDRFALTGSDDGAVRFWDSV